MKKTPGDIITLRKCTKNHDHMLYCSWDMVRDRCNCYFSFSGIFPSTFLQPVNGSKNSILNWVIMKLNLFMLFLFFLFCFETPLKDFPFYSLILLTLCFRYLQTSINESFIYLSSHLFFKTPHETLRFQETSKKYAFSSDLQT